mmetsp:Transcript_3035/g.5831  ORF Transcript_3035/g.5831 Transcript_3035/m.5831 type:complete len:111 (-) Transcript_3035:2138-2470(-)
MGQLVSTAITVAIGFIYSGFLGYRALSRCDEQAKQEYLVFWSVMGPSLVVEHLLGTILAQVLPFYFLLRLVWITWLVLPTTRGADIVFNHFLGPATRYWQTRNPPFNPTR